MGVIIGTEEEFFHYAEKILELLEKDEELNKLNPQEQCFALTTVIYGLGFVQGREFERKTNA